MRGLVIGAYHDIDSIDIRQLVPISAMSSSPLLVAVEHYSNALTFEVAEGKLPELWPLLESVLFRRDDVEKKFVKTFRPDTLFASDFIARACTVSVPTPEGVLYCDRGDVFDLCRHGLFWSYAEHGIMDITLEQLDNDFVVKDRENFKGLFVLADNNNEAE